MSARVFFTLSSAGIFAAIVGANISNTLMMVSGFALFIMPSFAIVKQSEIK